MSDTWSVQNYTQFLDLRTRPARDLLAAIPSTFQPTLVYDLGCGPGNSTLLLKERWPQANIIGVDSSLAMLQEARLTLPAVQFIHQDITHFNPSEQVDALFANASLQWLSHHEVLLPRLFGFLKPGGVFAVQMPNNFHSPTHQVALQILNQHSNWKLFLKFIHYPVLKNPLYDPAWYYDLFLQEHANHIQLWETTYLQEMENYDSIFAWVKGTALRTFLSEMDAEQQLQFQKLYTETVATYFPLQRNKKVLLPFRRFFILVVK